MIIILLSYQHSHVKLSEGGVDDLFADYSHVDELFNFEGYLANDSTASGNLIDSPHLTNIQHQENNQNQVNQHSNSLHESQPIRKDPNMSYQFNSHDGLPKFLPNPNLESLIFPQRFFQYSIDNQKMIFPKIPRAGISKESQHPSPTHQIQAGDASFLPNFFNSAAKYSPMDHNHSDLPNRLIITSNLPENRGLKRQGASSSDVYPKKRKVINEAIGSAKRCILYPKPTQTGLFPVEPDGYPFHFELVDYNPAEIDGQLVVRALNNLQIKGQAKFLNDPGFGNFQKHDYSIRAENTPQKMFCLHPCCNVHIKDFFLFFAFLRSKNVSKKIGSIISWKDAQKKFNERLRTVWLQFDRSTRKERREIFFSPEISKYRDFVKPHFENKWSDLQGEILLYHSDELELAKEKTSIVEIATRVLPLYLFHIDMISTIIPLQKIDDRGDWLFNQRESASNFFFKLLKQILCPRAMTENEKLKDSTFIAAAFEDKIEDTVLKIPKSLSSEAPNFSTFQWKIIRYWMIFNRKDLLEETEMRLSQRVKEFFNALATSLADE